MGPLFKINGPKNNIQNPLFVVGNGIEVLEILNSGNMPLPKIIILDINILKINGIELLKVLRGDENNAEHTGICTTDFKLR
jgi:CheY-like chemotaxis protein